MKKIISLLAVSGALLFAGKAWAVTQPQGLGDSSITKIVLPPTSQVNISTFVSVASSTTFMMIESTGGATTGQVTFVNDATNTKWPAISTATALSGQILVLHSTTTASSVKIETGTVTGVGGAQAFYVISSSMAPVQAIFNATLQQWWIFGKQ